MAGYANCSYPPLSRTVNAERRQNTTGALKNGGSMKPVLKWILILPLQMSVISCQPSASGGDSAFVNDTDSTPWVYDGPTQQGIGVVSIQCNAADLVTADCGAASPSPCVPISNKILCGMAINDENGVVQYSGLVGIEQWGRGSGVYNKPDYEFEMRMNDGETANPYPLLGMGKEEDWILDGSWTDRSFMRLKIVFDIFKEIGKASHVAADTRYVMVTFNDDARGIYRLTERIKRDDDRVDIPKDNSAQGDSFIVKLDKDGQIQNLSIGADVSNWLTVYPSKNKVVASQITGIQAWLTELANNMSNGKAFDSLNKPNVVDWVLINEFAKNRRTYEKGWYLFKSGSAKANLIPSDVDMSFGQPDTSAEGWAPHNAMTANLLKASGFQAELASRWAALRTDGPLSNAALTKRIDDYLQSLPADAIQRNFAIWPMADSDSTFVNFDSEITVLRKWITDRLAWMDANIAAYQ
jgi:hypothetical protein